jgi:hypothetical protein
MADDNSARKSNDPFGRGPAQATPSSDPLAELARLIGQNDPFGEYARDTRPAPAAPTPVPPQQDFGAGHGGIPTPQYEPAPPPYNEPAPRYVEPAPPRYSEPPPVPRYSDPPVPHYSEPTLPRYSDPAPAPQYGQDHSQPAAPRYSEPAPPRYSDPTPTPRYAEDHAAHRDWPGLPQAPSFPSSDPFALPPQQHASPLSALRYDNHGSPNPGYGSQAYADPHGRVGTDGYPSDRAGFGAGGFPAPPDRQGHAQPLYPQEPEAGSMPAPHDDEFYDDEPRGRRRKGLLTVAAVLGLAVIGTAGAFGYRSIFGSSGSSSAPPVIRASGEPSKVAPPAATSDTSAGKFSYDRFGDAGKDEQVVRREEKPVDLSKAAPPPRFPAPAVANSPATRPAGSSTTAANPPSAIGEPRRVRTVPIRPDQGGDAAQATPLAQQSTSAVPPRQANAAAAEPPRPSSRVASRTAPPAAAAQAPSGNAPLSLSPDANSNPLPPPGAQESFPPPPRASAPPPARIASAPASGGGGYLVQVSSQRSEADAENAYRGIQSKYSSVLGSRPHTVRRADLGSKGVYYRAMVGPFGSREEAVQLCSSLKQAGGDCVVQQ